MPSENLTKMYADLKSSLQSDRYQVKDNNLQNPNIAANWRANAVKERDKLCEANAKRIILDIYVRTSPLDSSYIDGNMGKMKNDVDNFLDQKGTGAYQYLRDAKEKTNAPLLEFVIRGIDNIGRSFMEKADETLKDAKEKKLDVPPPIADEESEENQSQLVDIQKDEEYSSFIDKLKEKTVNKIVNDISKMINDKKEENKMKFEPKPVEESVVSVGMDYFNKRCIKEEVEISPDAKDQMIAVCIREASLNEIDRVFNQIGNPTTRIRFGKGTVVNESAFTEIFG